MTGGGIVLTVSFFSMLPMERDPPSSSSSATFSSWGGGCGAAAADGGGLLRLLEDSAGGPSGWSWGGGSVLPWETLSPLEGVSTLGD